MFACIFFLEDVSLSVVNKNDKKLEMLGAFKPKEKVRMMWRKKMYNGTIIKVSDIEDELDKFAAKANKAVLEGKTSKEKVNHDIAVENLLRFEIAQKSSGKRQHIPTEKLKESQEQDEQLSPRKKKREQSAGKKEPESDKNVAKKKKKETQAVVPDKKEMPPSLTSKKSCQESTSLETGKIMLSLMSKYSDKAQVSQIHAKQINRDICVEPKQMVNQTLEQAATPDAVVLNNTADDRQGTSMGDRESEPVVLSTTTLSESWRVCREAISTLEGHPVRSALSSDILKTLQAISNPDFVKFVSHLAEHLQNEHSCDHPCLRGIAVYPENHQGSFLMDLTGSSTDNNSFDNSSVFTDLTSTPNKADNQTSCNESSYPSFSGMVASPIPMGQNSSKCQEIKATHRPSSESETYTQDNFNKSTCEQVKVGLRRSPRKAYSIRDIQDTPSDMVKLLKTGDLMVDRNKLRKATSKARNKSDYVTSWCQTNKVRIPSEAEMNLALTERIGYARKKQKGSLKKH